MSYSICLVFHRIPPEPGVEVVLEGRVGRDEPSGGSSVVVIGRVVIGKGSDVPAGVVVGIGPPPPGRCVLVLGFVMRSGFPSTPFHISLNWSPTCPPEQKC